jgi:hypothetical protein
MWRAIATASKKHGSQVSLFRDDRQGYKLSLIESCDLYHLIGYKNKK